MSTEDGRQIWAMVERAASRSTLPMPTGRPQQKEMNYGKPSNINEFLSQINEWHKDSQRLSKLIYLSNTSPDSWLPDFIWDRAYENDIKQGLISFGDDSFDEQKSIRRLIDAAENY